MARGIVDQETGEVTITAGAGKYYPSVSHYQTGSVNSGSLIGLYTKDVAVTFDTPMPDGDYIVTFDINSGSTTSVITGLEAANKTPTGFTARFFIKEKSASSTDQTWSANWQAFKLVTDKSAQYAEDKLAALESKLSNKQDALAVSTATAACTIKGNIQLRKYGKVVTLQYYQYDNSTLNFPLVNLQIF